MVKLFLKHANMQNANFGRTTAAPDILKTSTSLSYLKKLFKRANIFIKIFFIYRNDMQTTNFNIFTFENNGHPNLYIFRKIAHDTLGSLFIQIFFS